MLKHQQAYSPQAAEGVLVAVRVYRPRRMPVNKAISGWAGRLNVQADVGPAAKPTWLAVCIDIVLNDELLFGIAALPGRDTATLQLR